MHINASREADHRVRTATVSNPAVLLHAIRQGWVDDHPCVGVLPDRVALLRGLRFLLGLVRDHDVRHPRCHQQGVPLRRIRAACCNVVCAPMTRRWRAFAPAAMLLATCVPVLLLEHSVEDNTQASAGFGFRRGQCGHGLGLTENGICKIRRLCSASWSCRPRTPLAAMTLRATVSTSKSAASRSLEVRMALRARPRLG
jgi:hypothetical protein